MLTYDVVRGKHSTGVAAVQATGDFQTIKVADVPHALFDMKSYDKLRAQQNYVLMGHNRYATKGAVNKRNAHPFEFEDVVGCHNGTIKGQWRLTDYKDFEVDSENIFHSIQNEGVEATLEVLDGAYALSYWDRRADQFILLRNKERPLCYAYSEDGKTMFYASEDWMIAVACYRENVKIGKIEDMDENTIYRFNIDMRTAQNSQPIIEEKQAFDPFVAPSYQGGQSGSSVTPFRGQKKEEGKSEGVVGQMRELDDKFRGTTIGFQVVGDAKTSHKQAYVSCLTSDLKEEYEVRIFCSAVLNKDVYEDLHSQDDCLFQGTVVAAGVDYQAQPPAPYLIVNYKTVELYDGEEDEDAFQSPALMNS